MPSFKEPSFQERATLAAQARQTALNKLRTKPPVDPAVLAEKQAAFAARKEAEAQAAAEKRAAREQEKAERQAQKLAAAAANPAKAPVVELTEAEKKAARDARYAARKNRKNVR